MPDRVQPLVVKGGSKTWTVTYREGIPYTKRLGFLGFRCVLPVEGGALAPGAAATPGAAPLRRQTHKSAAGSVLRHA